MGVVKAYTTRVGNGPFPTELDEKFGTKIRELGSEFGSVTGRPRRCGWLDLVQLKYAMMVNGIDELAVTKLDVLDTIDELKICTEYRMHGKRAAMNITDARELENVTPVYESVKGWNADTTKAKAFRDLPPNAQAYLKYIEEYLQDVKIKIVSVGQERDETILM
jgi:adenylosuccinate synthase